jgi:hypothetical protein
MCGPSFVWRLSGCEACSEDAELPFENILDRLTGSDPSVTDYVLEVPARCLRCGVTSTEKTLVEWSDARPYRGLQLHPLS